MYVRALEQSNFSKIDNYFENLKSSSSTIKKLIKTLNDYGDIIVIGGTIRDILINRKEPRDIDLIIDTNIDLDLIIMQYEGCTKNRFGGYKLRINDIEFDIWSIENHWAFKEKILQKSMENLRYSTFLNFDSVFYNLTKKVADSCLFNECIATNLLDITLDKEFIDLNPSKEINILRMLLIKSEWNFNLSEKCSSYIRRWLKTNQEPVENLYEAQFKHYKYEKISTKSIENLIYDLI